MEGFVPERDILCHGAPFLCVDSDGQDNSQQSDKALHGQLAQFDRFKVARTTDGNSFSWFPGNSCCSVFIPSMASPRYRPAVLHERPPARRLERHSAPAAAP